MKLIWKTKEFNPHKGRWENEWYVHPAVMAVSSVVAGGLTVWLMMTYG